MTAARAYKSKLLERFNYIAYGGIRYFSLAALPLLIALFTAVAWLFLPTLYPATSGEPLQFRTLPLEAQHPSLQANLVALQTLPKVDRSTFHQGAWFALELPQRALQEPVALDFPARGAESIACWRDDTFEMLGSAQGTNTSGAMRTSRLGYALMLGANEDGQGSSFSRLMCEARYSGPTTFTAHLWSIPDLRIASDRFHRGIALLEGSIITLAVFLSIIAWRHREWAFLLLAVWLIGNLRLGTYALGWDGQWLGFTIDAEWRAFLRKFTIAAYYIVTHTLFTYLFRPRGAVPSHWWLVAVQGLGLVQLASAFLLPWDAFRVLSWGAWGVAVAVGFALVSTDIARNPSRLLSWRFISLSAALIVILSGLVLTLIGQEELLDTFTGVVALLFSNILVALAVSDILREGRTQRMRAQTDLVTSYAVAPLGLFTLDSKGRFLSMNPILRDMLDVKDDSTPHYWKDYFPEQDWAAVAQATLAGNETEIRYMDPHGERNSALHFALRAAVAGEHVDGSLQDITARARAMSALRTMVDNDPLTDALNRRGVEKQLEEVLLLLKASNIPCSLAYMDLDHFKRINGLFGHTSGDEILKQVTERIRGLLQEDQSVGRIGSDEFVIIFPNLDASEARVAAELIITELNGSSYQVGQRVFHVRSAIGVVELHAGMDPSSAISAASRACRDARKQHQDVVVYEQDSSELQAHTEELRLFDQLEGGASPKGLYLEMQPIMALNNSDDTLNFEILLRVRDSHGRLLPTGKIVSAAEESGTITIIDKWVFSATLEWMGKHEDRLRKTQFVNVNLSGVSLNDDKFIDNLFTLLARHASLARRLCVEITEGVALQNLGRTRRLITHLQSMGVRIALDDFGAGYTSFNYLKELGADAVKIDGTFVRDMMTSETNVAIVRTIVELAQNLGMTIIAEWVEDPRALEVLREMGVDYVQGHAISTALTPMEILDAECLTDLVANPDTLAYVRRTSQQPSLGLPT